MTTKKAPKRRAATKAPPKKRATTTSGPVRSAQRIDRLRHDPELVHIGVLARSVGCQPRRIREYAAAGIIDQPSNGFVPFDSYRRLYDHFRTRISPERERLMAARTDAMEAETRRKERQNKLASGRSIDTEKHHAVLAAFGQSWLQPLKSLPARVPRECRAQVRAETKRVEMMIHLDWLATLEAAAEAQGHEAELAHIRAERDDALAQHQEMEGWVEYGRLPRPGEPGYDPRPRHPLSPLPLPQGDDS